MEEGRAPFSAELPAIGARLRKAIVEIQSIEIQSGRLAENTSITACHIGEVGNPRIVVAGSMQELGANYPPDRRRWGMPRCAVGGKRW
jgi:hypothetical protein